MSNLLPTSSLPRALRVEDHYKLRRVDGRLSIWIDYVEDGEKVSYLVREEISYAEDFSTHVDDLKEEVRYLMAEFT